MITHKENEMNLNLIRILLILKVYYISTQQVITSELKGTYVETR